MKLENGRYTRIAVISDIHGNLEALKTVIHDIRKRNIDSIICLGDIIAKGSHPSECIEIVKRECDVVLQGNCDRHFTSELNLSELNEVERDRVIWNKGLLSEADSVYLQGLPFCHEFYMSGSLVRMFHATPWADNEIIDVIHDYDTKYNMFLPGEKTVSADRADIVIYGHLHHFFAERFYNRTLINAGSVGNSHDIIRDDMKDAADLETTQAVYLILEGEYGAREYGSSLSWQCVRVPYDINAELSGSSGNIELENYRNELLFGKYRNKISLQKI